MKKKKVVVGETGWELIALSWLGLPHTGKSLDLMLSRRFGLRLLRVFPASAGDSIRVYFDGWQAVVVRDSPPWGPPLAQIEGDAMTPAFLQAVVVAARQREPRFAVFTEEELLGLLQQLTAMAG